MSGNQAYQPQPDRKGAVEGYNGVVHLHNDEHVYLKTQLQQMLQNGEGSPEVRQLVQQIAYMEPYELHGSLAHMLNLKRAYLAWKKHIGLAEATRQIQMAPNASVTAYGDVVISALTGNEFRLQGVEPFRDVKQLTAMVQHHKGVDPEQQKLICDGKVPQPGVPLEQYFGHSVSRKQPRVQLVMRLRGGY